MIEGRRKFPFESPIIPGSQTDSEIDLVPPRYRGRAGMFFGARSQRGQDVNDRARCTPANRVAGVLRRPGRARPRRGRAR